MKALVTGAFGFAGRHLIDHLLAAGDSVLATYIDDAPATPLCSVVSMDITDPLAVRRVIADFRPDIIYNLAGVAFFGDAENDFRQTLAINVQGVHNVFQGCYQAELAARVLLVSSAEVYGRFSANELPLVETTPLRPANNYSLSKAMAELIPLRFAKVSKVVPIIVRPFNHIGAGQRTTFVVSSFAYQLSRVARGEEPPTIQVGNIAARRDFSDVRDIVRGYRLAALKGAGIYNLSSGRAPSVGDILTELIKISGVDVEIKSDPDRMRPSEIPEIRGSYEKAAKELGWQPTIALQDSLKSAYEFWLNRSSDDNRLH